MYNNILDYIEMGSDRLSKNWDALGFFIKLMMSSEDKKIKR